MKKVTIIFLHLIKETIILQLISQVTEAENGEMRQQHDATPTDSALLLNALYCKAVLPRREYSSGVE